MRRVALPEGVDADKPDAKFDNGTLKVTMPMQPVKEVKAIDVK
jgi:HSP20 family molecular chaperone IbpA